MKVYYVFDVIGSIKKLSEADQARLERTKNFFQERGFLIGSKYIKKLSGVNAWELRAGRIRIFLKIKGGKAIGVHLLYKKSNKTPRKDINLVKERVKQV